MSFWFCIHHAQLVRVGAQRATAGRSECRGELPVAAVHVVNDCERTLLSPHDLTDPIRTVYNFIKIS
jgi:hypothetical protein